MLELDDQLALHPHERLVGIGMAMPAELLGHDTEAHLMIVHRTKRYIVVVAGDG